MADWYKAPRLCSAPRWLWRIRCSKGPTETRKMATAHSAGPMWVRQMERCRVPSIPPLAYAVPAPGPNLHDPLAPGLRVSISEGICRVGNRYNREYERACLAGCSPVMLWQNLYSNPERAYCSARGVFVICAIIPIIPSMLPLNIIAIIALHLMGLCLCVSGCVSLIIINIPAFFSPPILTLTEDILPTVRELHPSADRPQWSMPKPPFLYRFPQIELKEMRAAVKKPADGAQPGPSGQTGAFWLSMINDDACMKD
eukprot:g64216.t1